MVGHVKYLIKYGITLRSFAQFFAVQILCKSVSDRLFYLILVHQPTKIQQTHRNSKSYPIYFTKKKELNLVCR